MITIARWLQQDTEKKNDTSIESARERSRASEVTLVRLCELMRRPASQLHPGANPYVNDTLLSPVTAGNPFFFFSPPLTTACDDTAWSIIHLLYTVIARYRVRNETGLRPDVIHEWPYRAATRRA